LDVVIERGDVVWVDFGLAEASEPAYRRPAVVVQADAFNRSELATLLVVPLTSNVALGRYPGNVLIPEGAANLPRDSVALVTQLTTTSRSRVERPVGAIPPDLLRQISSGLRLVLAL
jgi:mRNA interferase MazF